MALHSFEGGELVLNKSDITPMIEAPVDMGRNPITAGVFTTISVKDKIAVFLEDHLTQLYGNAEEIGLHLNDANRNSIEDAINLVIAECDNREYGIRPVLWHLHDDGEFDLKRDLTIYPFNFYREDKWYDYGIDATLLGWPRQEAHIKSVVWTNSLHAERCAQKRGFQEAILTDKNGHIYEGSRSNVFWVYGNVMETPENNILKGVTRSKILAICANGGINVVEGDYDADRLCGANEVFLTNTVKKILPVVQIDKVTIGAGVPGNLTKLLMNQYGKLIDNYVAEKKRLQNL